VLWFPRLEEHCLVTDLAMFVRTRWRVHFWIAWWQKRANNRSTDL